jgi:hypothetical protein
MGASTLLDIIGSFIVFGMLLLSGLGMDLNAINDRFAYNTAVNLQLQLVSLTAQIENDFQKIGYDPTSTTLTNPSSSAVRYGNANDFRFAGDMNNDGSIDSVEYLLGPSQNLSNPDICILVRKFWDGSNAANNRVDSIKAGVTQLLFAYYMTNTDSPINPPVNYSSGVGMIRLSLSLQSPDKFTGSTVYQQTDTSLYSVYWKQFEIVSKNMTWR